MKIAILEKENESSILRVYNIPTINKSDFTQWNTNDEIRIALEEFIETVQALMLVGDETQGAPSDPNYIEITPFLPKYLQDKFKQREDSSDIFAVNLDKKLLMLKVAEEICHDYFPNNAYNLRIYE